MITKTAYNLVCSETAKRLKQKKKKQGGSPPTKKESILNPIATMRATTATSQISNTKGHLTTESFRGSFDQTAIKQQQLYH
jgi:hypothetical protein